MSIICTTYIPDGIIMAADSRITINMNLENREDPNKKIIHTFPFSDNGQKIYLLHKVQVGISAVSAVFGEDMKGIAKFLRDFERDSVKRTDGVFEVADKLHKAATDGIFHVAGYDGSEPFVYTISRNEFKRMNVQGTNIQYGVTCSGEAALFQKFMGTEPRLALNFKSFSVDDAADFTDFLIETTIKMQAFEMKPKTCGGAVDILVLTPEGAFWKKNKSMGRKIIPMPSNQSSSGYVTDEDGNPIN